MKAASLAGRIFILVFLWPAVNCFCMLPADTTRELSGFRNIPWGSSKEEVRTAEKSVFMQSFTGFGIEALSFKGRFENLSARIDFTFRDNKLIEGSYSIEPQNSFTLDFSSLVTYLTGIYGKPEFKSGKNIDADSVWSKQNDYGLFTGPALYWQFKNGFVALHSQRFINNVTITILFTIKSKLSEYLDDAVKIEDFNYNLEKF